MYSCLSIESRLVSTLIVWASVCPLWLVLPAKVGADLNLVAPGRVIDPARPLRLSLLVSREADAGRYTPPEVLHITLTTPEGVVHEVALRREHSVTLSEGEIARVAYVGALPPAMRGEVRVDAVGLDAPTMLVTLATPTASPGSLAADSTIPDPTAPSVGAMTSIARIPTTAADRYATLTMPGEPALEPNRQSEGRLSFFEPMFFIAGGGSDANAQIQLSFKLRLYEPSDTTSRAFLHNLYFGYTQPAFWDLSSYSKPFIDNNYIPSFFYYLPATDWRVAGNPVGIAAGYEHESNGKDGDDTRSIDTLFVRPYFSLGDTSDFHWSFSPKLYAYIEKSENSDIARYRGYADFHLSYGKQDDWQMAWILRKGTKTEAYSAEMQLTYPLNQWSPGLAGYLMLQAFSGYGEYLLDYNEREPWSLRIGYAIWR